MPGLDAEQIDVWDYWDEAAETPKTDTTMDKSIPEMVEEFATTMGQATDPDLSANLMREEYYEWHHEFFKSASAVKELKELADLTYVIFGYARSRGWDLMEATLRVHENNMGRCVQPDGTIQRRADGKIMKNLDYPAVDLSDLV